MSPAPNFGQLLDRAPSEVERPKPLPQGQYLCVVKGLPRYDKSSKKQTEFVEFNLVPLQVGSDVDQGELDEWAAMKDGTTRAITDAIIRATYYLTEGALWRLKEFFEHCGLDVEEGESLRALIDETTNCQVVAYIRHEASDDGEAIFSRLGKTASAEAFGE